MSIRKNLLLLPFLVLFLLVFTSLASAQSLDQARKEIQTAYDHIGQALEHKDAKAYGAILSKDFQTKGPNGQAISVDQVVEAMGQLLQPAKTVQAETELLSIKEGSSPSEAIVEANYSLKIVLPGPDGKDHELIIKSKSREGWTNSGGSWLLRSSEDLSQSVTMDGAPIQQ